MDFYSLFRAFADSWMLLGMTLFFVGCVLWVFRRSAHAAHDESAGIPFRHEDRPADAAEQPTHSPDPKAPST